MVQVKKEIRIWSHRAKLSITTKAIHGWTDMHIARELESASVCVRRTNKTTIHFTINTLKKEGRTDGLEGTWDPLLHAA